MKTFTSHFIVIFTLLFLSPLSWSKKSSPEKSPFTAKKIYSEKIISYYQWASLNTQKKSTYILGMRELYGSWEDHQSFFKISSNNRDAASKWTLLQNILALPSAVAADPSECSYVSFETKIISDEEFKLCARIKGRFSIFGSSLICYNKDDDKNKDRVSNWVLKCKDSFTTYMQKADKLPIGPERTFVGRHTTRYALLFSVSDLGKEMQAKNDRAIATEDTPAKAAKGTQCTSAIPTCGTSRHPPDIGALRKSYQEEVASQFNPSEQPCVIGGFVSELNPRKKCTPKGSLKIGSWKGTCERGKTMCNPVMFGFDATQDGAPICVPLNQDVTSQCTRTASALGNPPDVIAKQILGQSGLSGLNKITIEDFADLWQKHRVGLSQLCSEKTHRLEFFCSECTRMNMQVRDMNMTSTCADSCGRIPADDVSACLEAYKSKGAPATQTETGTN